MRLRASRIMSSVNLVPMLALAAIHSASLGRTLFDDGWKFAFGNAADPTKDFGYGLGDSFLKAGSGEGAIGFEFDDSDWRTLDLPHDWAIETPFDGTNRASLHISHGCRSVGASYPETSIGWYRKHFIVPKEHEGKRLSLEFDGIFRDSTVWINGHYLGRNLSGYAPFRLDFTDFANYGGDNVVTVRADATHGEGWFYEGAGIYRHVWLSVKEPVHIPQWGLCIKPSVKNDGSGVVASEVELTNESNEKQVFDLALRVYDSSGKAVAEIKTSGMTLEPWSSAISKPSIEIAPISLWSIEQPTLYVAEATITREGRIVDQQSVNFGFRTLTFDKDKGLFLNGKHVKIRGACNHQDHAGVGSAMPDRLQDFRIETLKHYGFNAYRTSHNPPTSELLDACDRLGMLVLDENRILGSSDEVLSQLDRLVKRDRNHPSVMAWSICNEEPEANTDRGGRLASTMIRHIRALDPTRPITAASNAGNAEAGFHPMLDLRGFNYKNISNIDEYRKKHPEQILFGSEEASTLATRGIYANDRAAGYMSAYDLNQPGWGAVAEDWQTFYADREWLAGAFVWTGFDYRGEPTPYQWPCISSHFGVLDTCGFPKDDAFYYQAWWTDQPVLHLLPHWNWAGKEGQPIDVWCFSNHDEVELFLNGKSQGKQKMLRNGHLEWKVPYAPGKLSAVGYRSGKQVQETVIETTGAPAKLVLKPDRDPITSDGRDIAIVEVSAVDAQGRWVPTAGVPVTFRVEGAGKLIGVGNGDPSCHEPDKYFTTPISRNVEGWLMAPIASRESVPKDFKPVNVSEANQMPANSFAVFRTSFQSNGPTAGAILHISRTDDQGWIKLNGKEIGQIKAYDEPLSIDVSKLLKKGQNELEIVVRNNQGPGGLGPVKLSTPGPEAKWSRSLFNGLAQAILQSNEKPGKITLIAESPGLQPARLEVKAGG